MYRLNIDDLPTEPLKRWVLDAQRYLMDNWGLNRQLALGLALMAIYAYYNDISLQVISGYRSRERQQMLLDRWLSGDRSGLAAKPAVRSAHTNEDFDGNPDAKGVDINSNHLNILGEWAPYFGLKWGGTFRKPDLVHFFI